MPGVKLIGVRVTLIRGPWGLLDGAAGGGAAADAAGSAGSGAASGEGSVVRSGVGDGGALELAGVTVAEGVELALAGGTGVEVLVSSRGVLGISPEVLPVTSSAVATTNTAAANPMSSRSSRGLRYHGDACRDAGIGATLDSISQRASS